MLLEELRETPIAAVRHQSIVSTLYGAVLVIGSTVLMFDRGHWLGAYAPTD
jgi:hypothetical protein